MRAHLQNNANNDNHNNHNKNSSNNDDTIYNYEKMNVIIVSNQIKSYGITQNHVKSDHNHIES